MPTYFIYKKTIKTYNLLYLNPNVPMKKYNRHYPIIKILPSEFYQVSTHSGAVLGMDLLTPRSCSLWK